MMPLILWTPLFSEAQGYNVKQNKLYQDNKSTILLSKNGTMSSSKKTQHIESRYFFVKDYQDRGHVKVEYCPTDDMVGDYFSKPLQGKKFYKFRKLIMNN